MLQTIKPRRFFQLQFLIASSLILSALALQYIGGYAPCPLCVWQRYPYLILIPVAIYGIQVPKIWLALVLGVTYEILMMLSFFHVGVEMGWWAGLGTCGGSLPAADSVAALRASLQNAPVVSCEDPALTILGLSLAMWHVLIASLLGTINTLYFFVWHKKQSQQQS